jgi:hypothetical protein
MDGCASWNTERKQGHDSPVLEQSLLPAGGLLPARHPPWRRDTLARSLAPGGLTASTADGAEWAAFPMCADCAP